MRPFTKLLVSIWLICFIVKPGCTEKEMTCALCSGSECDAPPFREADCGRTREQGATCFTWISPEVKFENLKSGTIIERGCDDYQNGTDAYCKLGYGGFETCTCFSQDCNKELPACSIRKMNETHRGPCKE